MAIASNKLQKALAFITRKPRYMPEIVWSDKSWTHNVFRAYEKIFGRRFGIKPEMRSSAYEDENGNLVVEYELYSFESIIAFAETWIRNLPKRVWEPSRVVNFQLAPVNGFRGPSNPFIHFAIALDTASTFGTAGGDTTTPTNWTHTCTGSDLTLALGTHVSASSSAACNVTAATYNAVALSKVRADTNATTFYGESSIWLLGAPATGANSISFSWSGGISPKTYGGVVSYTGTLASSTADAHNGTNGTGTGAKSTTVNVVTANSWVFSVMTNQGSTSTLTPTETTRWNNTTVVNQAKTGGSDTNGTVAAGNKTMTWTIGIIGTNHTLSAASIAPAAAAVTIAPADIAISLTEDADTIAQDHVIATADVAISTIEDNDTIAQNHIVATQDIALSLTEDNTSIIENYTVVPQDIAVGLGEDTTTITQSQIIATQDIALALTEDATTIVESYVLGVQDITVSLTEDSTAISQNHIVGVQDIAVGVTEENTELIEGQIIATQDIAIAVSEDSTAITQVHLLSVDDISVALSLDNGSITQIHQFSPADLGVTTSIDAASFSLNYLVQPQDVSLSTGIDNTTLTQIHSLSLADIGVGTSLDATTVFEPAVLIPDDIAVGTGLDSTTINTSGVIVPQDIAVGVSVGSSFVIPPLGIKRPQPAGPRTPGTRRGSPQPRTASRRTGFVSRF